jgi:hypothetical protein
MSFPCIFSQPINQWVVSHTTSEEYGWLASDEQLLYQYSYHSSMILEWLHRSPSLVVFTAVRKLLITPR